jgi:hypothetical protein
MVLVLVDFGEFLLLNCTVGNLGDVLVSVLFRSNKVSANTYNKTYEEYTGKRILFHHACQLSVPVTKYLR